MEYYVVRSWIGIVISVVEKKCSEMGMHLSG